TTLTTGWRPMVLVTTPPHPASKARRMFDSDSVGGADESRNGLRKRTPVNVVERLGPIAASRRLAQRTLDRRFYQPERLVGGHENLVGVVEPEGREIDEQVVAIGQRQGDFDHIRAGGERRFAHRIQLVLHRTALVR